MRLAVAVFLALLLLPAVVGAGPLEDGEAAYNRHDDQTALKILLPLADQGNAAAQRLLGEIYAYSVVDDQAAAKWRIAAAESYRKAADKGDTEAQFQLGSMYHSGNGVRHDNDEAMKWYRKAADQGYGKAQYAVGLMYQRGSTSILGLWPNAKEAYFWYSLALSSGVKLPTTRHDINTRRDEVATELSSEERAAVDKRVAEWKPTPSQPPAPAEAPETK